MPFIQPKKLAMHTISASRQRIDCTVDLPLSKSIVNRLLILTRLAGGEAQFPLPADSADTLTMMQLLRQIGEKPAGSREGIVLDAGNAGTVMRFLTALLAVTPGEWLLTGSPRMKQRPIGPLIGALQSLGAEISFPETEGFPPLRINGRGDLSGGSVQLEAGLSSQFISALMMISPRFGNGLDIHLNGPVRSASYLSMTAGLMREAGIRVSISGNIIHILPGRYTLSGIAGMLEPDWSAAAFWYETVALATGARVKLNGLKSSSLQGDSVLPGLFKSLGVETRFEPDGALLVHTGAKRPDVFDYDFTDCPDLAQAVIVCCAGLGIPGTFTGLQTLRVKETDRIEALRAELSAFGCRVQVDGDVIRLEKGISAGETPEAGIAFRCYDDHRMAMAFAPLSLLCGPLHPDDPGVVVKSYPGFWTDMEKAGIRLG
jgi:3-phosphoshikimate 1-carboxyvinyltransferase